MRDTYYCKRPYNPYHIDPFYAFYPAKGVNKIRSRRGNFDLSMYCGIAFDPSGDVSNLCSDGEIGSLLIWNKEVIRELKAKEGDLQKVQLDAVVHLWEICFDLLLAE